MAAIEDWQSKALKLCEESQMETQSKALKLCNETKVLIPKGTKLYRGIRVNNHCRRGDPLYGSHKLFSSQEYSYFTSFPSASWYAFCSNYSRGERGKVVEYVLLKDVVCLNTSSMEALAILQSKNPPICYEGMSVLEYCFGYKPDTTTLRRYSFPDYDTMFTKWLLKLTDEQLEGVDGHCWFDHASFHNEVVLPLHLSSEGLSTVVIPTGYEFRFSHDYDMLKKGNFSILLCIKDGEYVCDVNTKDYRYRGGVVNIYYNGPYSPDPHNPADRYYFTYLKDVVTLIS